jgi:hypothetical protein
MQKYSKLHYVGLRSGKLLVTEFCSIGKNGQIVLCECDCGNGYTCDAKSLVNGSRKCCGCTKPTKIPKQQITNTAIDKATAKYITRPKRSELLDCIGKRYGQLTAVKMIGTKGRHKIISCLCDCGKELELRASSLVTGRSKSCGCVASYRANQIDAFLKNSGYQYQREIKFDDCRDKMPMPFDFGVWIDGQLKLIEYHGEQHYKQVKTFGNILLKIQSHDMMKEDYCHIRNIPLLVVNKWTANLEQSIDWFLNYDC